MQGPRSTAEKIALRRTVIFLNSSVYIAEGSAEESLDELVGVGGQMAD